MGDGLTSRRYRTQRAAFKKDCQTRNLNCWLCGHPINYNIPWKDPITGYVNDDAFELDHLYPRSTHPELAEDPGNFRPSHRACNRKRSNKLQVGSLGRVSRTWVL